ncbi:MAG: hypothetical protein HXY34_07760 [Candidatus Thorarchaeota archaeon]|nr:hypothetical protein [Candidatus Thorarchaeota archaeon]
MLAAIGRSGGGHGSNDNVGAAILIIILIVVAIPVIAFVILLLGAIVIIPVLFYAGLVSVAIESVKIIRRTDFVSLDQARERGLKSKVPVQTQEDKSREVMQEWSRSGEKPLTPDRHLFDPYYRG